MQRPRIAGILPCVIGFLAVISLAACSSSGASAPASAGASAIAEHSALPSASAMMEHSAAPSASAMMEHSAAPSVAAPVSTGTFHGVDGTAKGTVALFHKPDGTFAITFEDFSIASNAHTNVILVTNRDVTKDGDVDKTAIVDLGPLKGTSGMQYFVVPPSADAMTYHTVVLWNTEMTHPIAAAPLQ
jgi:hypothetical protein